MISYFNLKIVYINIWTSAKLSNQKKEKKIKIPLPGIEPEPDILTAGR